MVVAEPEIAVGDCRIEWADGGVVRDAAKTDLAIGNAIGRYLGARQTAAMPELGAIEPGVSDMSDDSKVPLPEPGHASRRDAAGRSGRRSPTAATPARGAADLEAVFDVPVQVSAVLGRASMDVGELLKLGPGTVLELDRKVGEAIDIYVNNRLVARGEVVLVEDKLGVTMTEIIKAERN